MSNENRFVLGWYKRPIGTLQHNGSTWEFSYDDGWLLPLEHQKRRGDGVPAFISNLLPEGYLAKALQKTVAVNPNDPTAMLRSSERYLGNLSVVEDRARLKHIPVDRLVGRQADFVRNGVFVGTLARFPEYTDELRLQLNALLSKKTMPNMSGTQAKIPMHLDADGQLSPADGIAFTHILKLPGNDGDNDFLRGVIEWTSMTLAQAAQIKTCEFALVEMAGGKLAYLTERFDVPVNDEDSRMIFCEDFCALKGAGPRRKFDATGEDVVDLLQTFSTDAADDSRQLLRLFVANYLLENTDFHLKNLALLKVAEPMLDGYRSLRLSPAFDIMNTRYFINDEDGLMPMSARDFDRSVRDAMVFSVNGADEEIAVADFVRLGARMGIGADESHAIIASVAHGIAERAAVMKESLPEVLDRYPLQREFVLKTIERAAECCEMMMPELPQEAVQSVKRAGRRPGH